MGPRPFIGSLNNVITRVENAGTGLFEKNCRDARRASQVPGIFRTVFREGEPAKRGSPTRAVKKFIYNIPACFKFPRILSCTGTSSCTSNAVPVIISKSLM